MVWFLLIWSIIVYLNIIDGFYFRSGFFCEDFIDSSKPSLRYQRSRTNSSIVFVHMKNPSYGHLSFHQAVKACKLCHDADLILPGDMPELVDSTLPAWIGITGQATLINNKASNVTWNPNIVENLLWPINTNINGTFAILIQPKNRFNNHTFLAVPLNIGFFYGDYPRGANSLVNSLICKAINANVTHHWSFEDELCIYHPTFGCHTYENHLQRSENSNETFVTNLTRKANQCPISNCTCSVTQWSHWSPCKELMCTDKPRNRTRSRKVIEFCRRNYVHERLSESESCPLPFGCDQLRKIHKSNDTLVLNNN